MEALVKDRPHNMAKLGQKVTCVYLISEKPPS
jgi:hypothetical protein